MGCSTQVAAPSPSSRLYTSSYHLQAAIHCQLTKKASQPVITAQLKVQKSPHKHKEKEYSPLKTQSFFCLFVFLIHKIEMDIYAAFQTSGRFGEAHLRAGNRKYPEQINPLHI